MKTTLLVSLLALAVGCDGYLTVDQPVGPRPDGGNAEGCDPIDTNVGDGHHNPGTDCQPCHNGQSASAFTMSGTLYNNAQGATPVAGAIVHVIDADGKDVKMRTTQNGNFWTTETLKYPITTNASGCPDKVDMITDVASPVGCNAASCHVQGFRVHLP